MDLSWFGSEFHSSDPYTLKAREAKVFFFVIGTCRSWLALVAALVALLKDFGDMALESVGGASMWMQLKIRQAILKLILSGTGGQWSSIKEALSNLDLPRTTLAAQFCTLWSGLIVVAGYPLKMLLA